MTESNTTPAAIVAVLGASNVTLALPQILGVLHRRLAGSGPTDYFIAHGPGRSYGMTAGLPGVEFAALNTCGLYEALEARWRSTGQPPVYVMLTDVGNDVMYGVTARGIAAWVREIVERFLSLDARVVITSVPVESVLRLPAWKYGLVRPLLYPSYPMLRRDVFTRIVQVQHALEDLSRSMKLDVLPTRREWYSIDGIHVARRRREHVFQIWGDTLLGGEDGSTSTARDSDARLSISSVRLRLCRPAVLFIAGCRLTKGQQGVEVAEGARLYLY